MLILFIMDVEIHIYHHFNRATNKFKKFDKSVGHIMKLSITNRLDIYTEFHCNSKLKKSLVLN